MTDSPTPIPREAFGKGYRITIDPITKQPTLHGADGHEYTELHIRRDQFNRVCDELGIPHPPPDWPPK